MGSSHRSYDYEIKLFCGARPRRGRHVEARRYEEVRIASLSPAELVGAKYREGGPEALRPKPGGGRPGRHPRRSFQDGRAGARRGEPQAQGRGRLPKKLRALKRQSEHAGEMPGDQELSGEGHRLADLLAASGVPASTYHYNKARPKAPTRPELWEGVAEVFRAPPTAAATGVSRCACVPRRKSPWRTRRCSRSCRRWA